MRKKSSIYKKMTDRIPSGKQKGRVKVMYRFINRKKQRINKKVSRVTGPRF